jgi:nucleoside-diphosphate kinase
MYNKIFIALSLFLVATLGAEQTLSLIKPEAVRAGHIGAIIARFEKQHLRIAALKMTRMPREQAAEFYAALQGRPFYDELINMMSSGAIVALILEGENAIQTNRTLMGATDPKKADIGTIRAEFGTSIGQNAVHGSDSYEAAKREIAFFFKPNEIVNAQ